jgi:hypothetical protein
VRIDAAVAQGVDYAAGPELIHGETINPLPE